MRGCLLYCADLAEHSRKRLYGPESPVFFALPPFKAQARAS